MRDKRDNTMRSIAALEEKEGLLHNKCLYDDFTNQPL
jgi:hypothetical protein